MQTELTPYGTELHSTNAKWNKSLQRFRNAPFPLTTKIYRKEHRISSLFFTSLSAGCGQLVRTPGIRESMDFQGFLCDTE